MQKTLKKTIYQNNKNNFNRGIYAFFGKLVIENFKNVLDVGCGKGPWSYLGAKKGKFKNIAGCDVFNDFKKKEIAKFANKVEYRQIKNGQKIPFTNDKFDLVFSMDVIEHVEDDKIFLSEKIRVARSGGKIIIGTPNYSRIGNLPLIATRTLNYPRKLGNDAYGDVIHLREYKKNDIVQLIESMKSKIDMNSFKIHAYYIGSPALNLGARKVPKIFEKFCQYWFVEFNKK